MSHLEYCDVIQKCKDEEVINLSFIVNVLMERSIYNLTFISLFHDCTHPNLKLLLDGLTIHNKWIEFSSNKKLSNWMVYPSKSCYLTLNLLFTTTPTFANSVIVDLLFVIQFVNLNENIDVI